MYVKSNSPKYVCHKCKNKIGENDMEEIFHSQLKAFLFSEDDIKKQLEQSKGAIEHKENHILQLKEEAYKINTKLNRLIELYQDGELPKEGFGNHYKPLHERIIQIQNEIPELQAETDFLKVELGSSDEIIIGTKTLQHQWPNLTFQDKRLIVDKL